MKTADGGAAHARERECVQPGGDAFRFARVIGSEFRRFAVGAQAAVKVVEIAEDVLREDKRAAVVVHQREMPARLEPRRARREQRRAIRDPFQHRMAADEVKSCVTQRGFQLKGVDVDEIHRQTERLRRRPSFIEQHLRAVGDHHLMPQTGIPQRHLPRAAADVKDT